MKKTTYALLACSLLVAASHAAADTYNFTTGGPGYSYGGGNSDYPTSTPVATPYGISSIAGTDGTFNQINDYSNNGGTFNNEKDASGTTTDVSITLAGFNGNDNAYQLYDPNESNESNNFDSGLFGHFDYAWAPNSGIGNPPITSSSITLNNLAPNEEFEIALYGYNGNGEISGEGRNFEVEGSGTSTEYLLEDTSDNGFESTLDTANSTTSLQEYIGNYLIVDGYSDASGTLTLTFTPIDNYYQTSDISGLQVEEIPEPATWAMLFAGLGLIAFWHIRSLRRQS